MKSGIFQKPDRNLFWWLLVIIAGLLVWAVSILGLRSFRWKIDALNKEQLELLTLIKNISDNNDKIIIALELHQKNIADLTEISSSLQKQIIRITIGILKDDPNFTSPSSGAVEVFPNESVQSEGIGLDRLFDAIMVVESSGNPRAIGPDDEIGAFQIRPVFLKDVNRICKLRSYPFQFGYADRLDSRRSRLMVRIYLSHYATQERVGRSVSFEDMARIINAGPDGYRQECSKGYWLKVKAQMEQ